VTHVAPKEYDRQWCFYIKQSSTWNLQADWIGCCGGDDHVIRVVTWRLWEWGREGWIGQWGYGDRKCDGTKLSISHARCCSRVQRETKWHWRVGDMTTNWPLHQTRLCPSVSVSVGLSVSLSVFVFVCLHILRLFKRSYICHLYTFSIHVNNVAIKINANCIWRQHQVCWLFYRYQNCLAINTFLIKQNRKRSWFSIKTRCVLIRHSL